ncbi:MAG: DUF4440 domain-containing protein [Mesorhizobium sp.]|nr:MAG: DUF4440 domain-containing protein [Mesorhizobium sp.]
MRSSAGCQTAADCSSFVIHGRSGSEADAAYLAWDAAFNKADAKAVAAFYTDDAIFLPATHDIIKAPDGVEKFFGGLFSMGVTGHKLELIEAEGDGNLLVGTAKWSAKGKDAKGADQPWAGVATHVFEKQADGSLKLLQLINGVLCFRREGLLPGRCPGYAYPLCTPHRRAQNGLHVLLEVELAARLDL